MKRQSTVTIYVRHQSNCRYANRTGRTFARDCNCVKWLRYSGEVCFCQGRKHGPHRQHKLTTGTRSWSIAEEKRADLQRRLDVGDIGTLPQSPEEKRPTIAQAVETFITAKLGEGCGPSTIRKLRHQLGGLEQFMTERSKFFPAEITATDLIEFRASWAWESGVTRQKAQQNLRAFLRSACKENLPDLLTALKTIRLSKADVARLEPQPFSETELQKLLEQIGVTFKGNLDLVTRLTVLVHFMVATGVAIRDAVQMEREHIAGGWLRFRRQKTNRPVEQRLDDGLHRELEGLANGNRYLFWNGISAPTSATGLYQTHMRQVMKDAGLWIEGNLFHRFRDTAVDFWFGQGASELEVATMLGDTVPIVEKHYRKLLSKRLQERLAKVPVRVWQ